jgi:hypothetical protein
MKVAPDFAIAGTAPADIEIASIVSERVDLRRFSVLGSEV